MIELEIIESNDAEILGKVKYQKDSVIIGNKVGDILINDPKIIDFHFSFEINDGELFPLLNRNLTYFNLNGKKVSGEFPLKKGDIVKIENTSLKIVDFGTQPHSQYLELYKKNLSEMIDRDDPFIAKMQEYQTQLKG